MLTKTIFVAGALLSLAAAIPMQQNKRNIVWETKIEEAVVTIDVTTTIWLHPGETPPVAPAGNVPGHYGHKHHGNNHQPHPSPPNTTPVAAPSSPVETSAAPPYVAPTTSAAPPAPPASSPYVAPSPTTPATTPAAAPTSTVPAYSPPAASPSSPPPSSGGNGQTYTGDLTYYTPGLGSCGVTNSASDAIVALAEGMMTAAQVGGNPNANPLCGKSITISYGGVEKTATIMDTCPGCSGGSLDLTPTLFADFAPLSQGRLTGMKWWYN